MHRRCVWIDLAIPRGHWPHGSAHSVAVADPDHPMLLRVLEPAHLPVRVMDGPFVFSLIFRPCSRFAHTPPMGSCSCR